MTIWSPLSGVVSSRSMVSDSFSLVIDAVDVVRFLRGDRAETVPGLEPPLVAIRRRT